MLRVAQLSGFAGRRKFVDNFDDNSISALLWTKVNSTDVTITESSGQINFASDASFSGSTNSATLTSVPSFDFTGKTLEIDLVSGSGGLGQSNLQSAGSQVLVFDNADSTNVAGIFVDQNGMGYFRNNHGTGSSSSETYSTNFQGYRIQHISADNTWKLWVKVSGVWTLKFTTAAANWNPTNVKIQLVAYIYGSTGQSKTTTFDNVSSNALY